MRAELVKVVLSVGYLPLHTKRWLHLPNSPNTKYSTLCSGVTLNRVLAIKPGSSINQNNDMVRVQDSTFLSEVDANYGFIKRCAVYRKKLECGKETPGAQISFRLEAIFAILKRWCQCAANSIRCCDGSENKLD
jgi:hypothetical protein